MVQIFEQNDPLASLGQATGEGLSAGLQMLINEKIKARQGQKFEALGLSPALSGIDPRIAGPIAKEQLAQQGLAEFLRGGSAPGSVTQDVDIKETPDKITEDVRDTERGPQGLERLSDEQLVIARGKGGRVGLVAEAELKRRGDVQKVEERREEKKGERHSRIAEKVIIKADERAAEIPQKEASLDSMELALKEGNLGFFSPDNLAEISGIEGLRSPEGALFKTASKEYFLGSLKRAGARPNQWIEKQIQDMLAKIGRSKEANLTVTAALRADLDVEKKGLDLTREIADEQEEKYGYLPRSLGHEVSQQLLPYAKKRQKELEVELRGIKSKFGGKKTTSGGVRMIDTQGKIRRVKKEEVQKAQAAGYRLEK